jgi:hypothetical protein
MHPELRAIIDRQYTEVAGATTQLKELVQVVRREAPRWSRAEILAEISRTYPTGVRSKVVYVAGLSRRGQWTTRDGHLVQQQ